LPQGLISICKDIATPSSADTAAAGSTAGHCILDSWDRRPLCCGRLPVLDQKYSQGTYSRACQLSLRLCPLFINTFAPKERVCRHRHGLRARPCVPFRLLQKDDGVLEPNICPRCGSRRQKACRMRMRYSSSCRATVDDRLQHTWLVIWIKEFCREGWSCFEGVAMVLQQPRLGGKAEILGLSKGPRRK
jgi:hypothetical protein